MRKPNSEVIGIYKPSREELIEQYSEKPVRGFLEIDYHGPCEEGALIHCHPTYELANTSSGFRVRIPEGAEKNETLYGLSEIRQMLEEDWHRLDELGAGFRPKPKVVKEREARQAEDERQ